MPSGWLALVLGTDTRSFHTFHGPELADESIFEARMSALVSEIGDRGKAQRVLAPGYGLAPVDAMMPPRRRLPAANAHAMEPAATTAAAVEVVAPTPAPVPATLPVSEAPPAQQVSVPAGLPDEDDFLSRLPPAAAAAVRKARGLPELPVAAPPVSVPPVGETPAPEPEAASASTQSFPQPSPAAEIPTTMPESVPIADRAKSFLDPNMAAGFSRIIREPKPLQQVQEPPLQESQELPQDTATPMKWGTTLADLAAACGAESPDALLDLTDDQLEQLIDETAAQNSSFKVNTLHQLNITKEARLKRAAAHQDPLLKFLTDLGVQRIYDELVHELGALYLEDLKDVEEADLDDLGLRKLEKRRLCRAIAELDELDQKLLRTPVAVSRETSPLQSSAVAERPLLTTAADTGSMQTTRTIPPAETSRSLVSSDSMQSELSQSLQLQEHDQQQDATVVVEGGEALSDGEAARGGSPIPASPSRTLRSQARRCPGTPSSWRDGFG